MMKDDLVYLRHIRDSITRIFDYTDGMARESFLSSPLHQSAVIREIGVIGEAAKRVSAKSRKANPAVP